MKIKIVRENKTPSRVHAKAKYLQNKEGYKKDQAYAIAYSMEEDGKLEEISAMAAGAVSFAGQGVSFGSKEEILADNEKEKDRSHLNNVSEMYSTAGLKPDSRNGFPLEDEFEGFKERSAMQNLKNVPKKHVFCCSF